MKKCQICNRKLGLIKFRTADGYICKACYKIASNNYERTVVDLSLAELKETFDQDDFEQRKKHEDNFFISRKINGYVLFDDQHKVLCLPNNARYAREQLKPEYYSFDSLKTVRTIDEKVPSDKGTLHKLKVQMAFNGDPAVVRDIVLIAKPISQKANIYHTMQQLASRINAELRSVIKS